MELLIAANPDPESRLPYLLRLPLAGGMVFRTSDTWPRTKALYCHPMPIQDWPDEPEITTEKPWIADPVPRSRFLALGSWPYGTKQRSGVA